MARPASFNEAAGIHRRKVGLPSLSTMPRIDGFNEAAGIHRRKERRPSVASHFSASASMRPPEFTGGKEAPGMTDNATIKLLQ